MKTNIDSNKIMNDNRVLRILVLSGAVFSPIIAFIWKKTTSDSNISVPASLAFTAGYLLIFILTYTNSIVKRNAYCLIYGIACFGSVITTYSSYIRGFPMESVLILVLVTLPMLLVLKKTSHSVYYIAGMLVLITVLLFVSKAPIFNRWFIIAFFAIFYLISYTYIKVKYEAQSALIKSEESYRNLVEISPLAITVFQNGKVVYANPSTLKLAGAVEPADILGKSILDFVHPDYLEATLSRIENTTRGEKIGFMEQKMFRLDGSAVEVEVNLISVKHRRKPAFMSIIKDITEHKAAENKLKEAELKYRSLVESSLVGVYLYQQECVIYVNPYLEELLGYKKEELYSMENAVMLFAPKNKSRVNAERYTMTEDEIGKVYRMKTFKKDGSEIYIETRASEFTYNGKPAFIGTVVDITHIRKAQEQIRHMAYHDALTGLPNRYQFTECLNHTLIQARKKGQVVGILFIDLDRFKIINDTLGHNFGDQILQQASERLSRCLSKENVLSRYGGDEFIIILKDTDRKDSAQIAKKIIDEFGLPFSLKHHEMFITPSIGISFFPEDGEDANTLVKNADAAMYLAKDRGRDNYQFYSASLNKVISRKMELENGLRRALSNNEFLLFYQPQIDLKTGKIAGMEALIRWGHPSLGMVSPAEFIPLAEETGLINPIGEWVLETACKQNKDWQVAGFPSIPVSVNVSGRQFQYSNFVEKVKNVLEKTGLNPSCLEIEISESVMQEIDKTTQIVNDLKALRIRISIDDFGTGYSSLNLLKDLAIDHLKIDPSFIRDIQTNPDTEVLIKFIIDMGHHLKFKIIAEGIEDEEQMLILRRNNCDMLQGYFFSEPLPAEDIEKLWCRECNTVGTCLYDLKD